MRLRALLRPLLGVCVIAVLVWRFGTGSVLRGLTAIDTPRVLAALGLGLLTTVCSARRWQYVARGLGISLPVTTAVGDYYRALLLNAVLPVGVLGDVHRAVHHGRQLGNLGKGARSVVLERVAGQVVTVTVAVVVLLARPRLLHTLSPAIWYVLGTAAVLVVAAVALRRHGRGRFHAWLANAFRDARFVCQGWTLAGIVAMSVLTFLGHVLLFLVAARAVGVTAGVGVLVPLVVLALLAMSLPMNIAGWGPREAALTLAFAAAGLNPAHGLSAAVTYGVLTLIASLPGVMVLLLRRGVTS